jgi:hypothetical protein
MAALHRFRWTMTQALASNLITTQDGINWVISFTATAERTAIQESDCVTQNLPDLFGCYGDELGKFLREYAKYCSSFPFVNSLPGPS